MKNADLMNCLKTSKRVHGKRPFDKHFAFLLSEGISEVHYDDLQIHEMKGVHQMIFFQLEFYDRWVLTSPRRNS